MEKFIVPVEKPAIQEKMRRDEVAIKRCEELLSAKDLPLEEMLGLIGEAKAAGAVWNDLPYAVYGRFSELLSCHELDAALSLSDIVKGLDAATEMMSDAVVSTIGTRMGEGDDEKVFELLKNQDALGITREDLDMVAIGPARAVDVGVPNIAVKNLIKRMGVLGLEKDDPTEVVMSGIERALARCWPGPAENGFAVGKELGLEGEDIKRAALAGIRQGLSPYSRLQFLLDIPNHEINFGISREDLHEFAPEIAESLIGKVAMFDYQSVEDEMEKALSLGIADEAYRQGALKCLRRILPLGEFNGVYDLVAVSRALKVKNEDFTGLKSEYLEWAKWNLSRGDMEVLTDTFYSHNLFGIDKESLLSLRNEMLTCIKHNVNSIKLHWTLNKLEQAKAFGITNEDISALGPMVITSVKQRLQKGEYDIMHVIQSGTGCFGWTAEDLLALKSEAMEGAQRSLSMGKYYLAFDVVIKNADKFNISQEDLAGLKPHVLQGIVAVYAGNEYGFDHFDFWSIAKILEQASQFGITREELLALKPVIMDGMVRRMSAGHTSFVERTLEAADELGITKGDLRVLRPEYISYLHKLVTEEIDGILERMLANAEFFGIERTELPDIGRRVLAGDGTSSDMVRIRMVARRSAEFGLTPADFRPYGVRLLKKSLDSDDRQELCWLASFAHGLGLQETDFTNHPERPVLGKAVFFASRDFGSYVTEDCIHLYTDIQQAGRLDDGSFPSEAVLLGVEKSGEEGLGSLRNRLREEAFSFMRKERIHPDFIAMPVLRSYLKKLVRFEDAQFGSGDDEDFSNVVYTANANREFGLDRLHHGYQNAFIEVPMALSESAKVVQEPEVAEGVRALSATFHDVELLASQMRDPQARPKALERIQKTLEASLDHALQELAFFLDTERSRLHHAADIDDRQRQGRLKGLAVKERAYLGLRDFRHQQLTGITHRIFGAFLDEAVSTESLKQLLLPENLAKNDTALDGYRQAVRSVLALSGSLRMPVFAMARPKKDGNITREQAGSLLDMTSHVITQEILGLGKGQDQPLSKEEKELRQASGRILRIEQIKKASDAFERALVASTETQTIEIIPSRGLLLELSGHIGDACWAGKYNIAKQYPNITSLTFMLKEKDEQGNPTQPNPNKDKVAGSCLLIEADDKEGNPILIMRGMNPLENAINQLMPKAFINQLMGYVEGVAKKMGRRPAIVIDNAAEASTNRPALANVLKPMRDNGALKPLGVNDSHYGSSLQPTNFNHYDISKKTFDWS